MTARCASCTYPLTISDSVACYECTSYFHIDCAQLFGFPYYELSSDPNRNTFHCTTCELLPLPGRQSEDDSDSDCECAMPSRQLDYHIEGQPDYSVDMNEIKGSVQDLSDLCKDMLREINEIKSINLTLRCCIENLRHENESRDRAVEELKRRLDAFERNIQRKTVETSDWDMDRLRPEEELERYMTPEPPESAKEDEIKLSSSQNIQLDHSLHDFKLEDTKTQDKLSECISPQKKIKTENEQKEHIFPDVNEEETYNENYTNVKSNQEIKTEPTDIKKLTNLSQEDEIEHTSKSSIETTPEDVKEKEENKQDWTWKANQAITLDSAEEETDITDEGAIDEESEEEDVDAQEWELLNEEIQTETTARQFDKDVPQSTAGDDKNADKEEEDLGAMEREQEEGWAQKYERSKRHAEEKEGRDQEYDNYEKDERDQESDDYLENDDETAGRTEIHSGSYFKEDRPEIESEKEVEKIREEGEEAEETTLAEEDGEKVPQEIEGEILSEGAVLTEGEPHPEGEVPLEGEPHTEEELLLEGERPKDEEGQPVLEGEEGAGGQSPEEGEVQPAEPPPPPEPEHTEEDLWHYLKEAVTSVHPATVEEFVQNLIGTLQHVPDEYLRPVIDANIKRATSPSVTDGEHLPAESHLEGEEAVPVEGSPTSDSLPGAEGEIALSADDQSAPILDDTPAAEEESAVPTEELSSEVPEDHHLVDEDSADPNEGYSALEGALFGAFWLFWVFYNSRGT